LQSLASHPQSRRWRVDNSLPRESMNYFTVTKENYFAPSCRAVMYTCRPVPAAQEGLATA
jgi:hypothetical protein